MSNLTDEQKYDKIQIQAIKKFGQGKWNDNFIKIKNTYKKKYGNDWLKPFVNEVSFDDSKPKKSPTKKEVKKLMKEVEAEVIAPKIKTYNVDELIKLIEEKLLFNYNSFIKYKY